MYWSLLWKGLIKVRVWSIGLLIFLLHAGLCSWVTYHLAQSKINTLRPRQNERHFADDIFTCIFLNENAWIPIKISLKFIPKGPINNIPALVLIMAWRRPGDKPLSEPIMVSLKAHICVTGPQWVDGPIQRRSDWDHQAVLCKACCVVWLAFHMCPLLCHQIHFSF